MNPEIVTLALLVGATTWAFRALPFWLDMSGLRPGGWVSRLLAATGPAAIAALFVASVMPLTTAAQVPLLAGSATVVAVWFGARSVVMATLAGALVYGVAFSLA